MKQPTEPQTAKSDAEQLSEARDENRMSKSQTAEKPWAGNRLGDPRQLLHEAAQLERMAADRRREATRLRAIAAAEDSAAERIDEAARDYRQWVRERETP